MISRQGRKERQGKQGKRDRWRPLRAWRLGEIRFISSPSGRGLKVRVTESRCTLTLPSPKGRG
jgi:hypothetical protein